MHKGRQDCVRCRVELLVLHDAPRCRCRLQLWFRCRCSFAGDASVSEIFFFHPAPLCSTITLLSDT